MKLAEDSQCSIGFFVLTTTLRVALLGRAEAGKLLGADIPASVDFVAYQSANSVQNKGSKAWTKDSGLLFIWQKNNRKL